MTRDEASILMMTFPTLLLAIALAVILRPSLWIVAMGIALVNWVQIASRTGIFAAVRRDTAGLHSPSKGERGLRMTGLYLTMTGLDISIFMNGAGVVERVYGLPGIGQLP